MSIIRARRPGLEVLHRCSKIATAADAGYGEGEGTGAPSFGLVGLLPEGEVVSARLVVAETGEGGDVLAGRPFVNAAFEECGCQVLWQEGEWGFCSYYSRRLWYRAFRNEATHLNSNAIYSSLLITNSLSLSPFMALKLTDQPPQRDPVQRSEIISPPLLDPSETCSVPVGPP